MHILLYLFMEVHGAGSGGCSPRQEVPEERRVRQKVKKRHTLRLFFSQMNGDAAARLLQHRGPLLVSFYPEEKGGPVAFQVDGEFRLCHRAKYATVEYERSFNVLRNTPVD